MAFISTYFSTSLLLQTVLLCLCSHCWLTSFLCDRIRPANPMQTCPSLCSSSCLISQPRSFCSSLALELTFSDVHLSTHLLMHCMVSAVKSRFWHGKHGASSSAACFSSQLDPYSRFYWIKTLVGGLQANIFVTSSDGNSCASDAVMWKLNKMHRVTPFFCNQVLEKDEP